MGVDGTLGGFVETRSSPMTPADVRPFFLRVQIGSAGGKGRSHRRPGGASGSDTMGPCEHFH